MARISRSCCWKRGMRCMESCAALPRLTPRVLNICIKILTLRARGFFCTTEILRTQIRYGSSSIKYTANITGLGTLRILEAIKDYESETGAKVKFYQASSSELFGDAPSPQNELTSFLPRSPYGVSKLFAYHTTKNYREGYGIFAVNGILFN